MKPTDFKRKTKVFLDKLMVVNNVKYEHKKDTNIVSWNDGSSFFILSNSYYSESIALYINGVYTGRAYGAEDC